MGKVQEHWCRSKRLLIQFQIFGSDSDLRAAVSADVECPVLQMTSIMFNQ